MTQLPQSRVLLYLFCFSILPLLWAFYDYTSTSSQLDELQERVVRLQETASQNNRKQAANQMVRTFYDETDRFYIDKHIESINLLEKESDALRKMVNQPYVAEDPRITRRISTLANNTPVFSEGMVISYPFFNEIPETLARPIEVDNEDIKKLLARLEGVKIGPYEPGPNRPQLILTDFRFDRKGGQGESDVYSLNFKLIKREFL